MASTLDNFGCVGLVRITNNAQHAQTDYQLPIKFELDPGDVGYATATHPLPLADGSDIRVVYRGAKNTLPLGVCDGEWPITVGWASYVGTNPTIFAKLPQISVGEAPILEVHFKNVTDSPSTSLVNNTDTFQYWTDFPATEANWWLENIVPGSTGPVDLEYPPASGIHYSCWRCSGNSSVQQLKNQAALYLGSQPWATQTTGGQGMIFEGRYWFYNNGNYFDSIPLTESTYTNTLGISNDSRRPVRAASGNTNQTGAWSTSEWGSGPVLTSTLTGQSASVENTTTFGIMGVGLGCETTTPPQFIQAKHAYIRQPETAKTAALDECIPGGPDSAYITLGMYRQNPVTTDEHIFDWVRVRSLTYNFEVVDGEWQTTPATLEGIVSTVLPKPFATTPEDGETIQTGPVVLNGRFLVDFASCTPFQIVAEVANNPEFITDPVRAMFCDTYSATHATNNQITATTSILYPNNIYYWRFKVISSLDATLYIVSNTRIMGALDPTAALPAIILTNAAGNDQCLFDTSLATSFGIYGENNFVAEWCKDTIYPNIVTADDQLYIGIENPDYGPGTATHLTMTPQDTEAFPPNIRIINEHVTFAARVPIGQEIVNKKTIVVDEQHLTWWPVKGSLEEPGLIAAGGRAYTANFMAFYEGQAVYFANKPFSLFKVNLQRNALNKITVNFFTVTPGDYTYDSAVHKANFTTRTVYIAYYPDFNGTAAAPSLDSSVLPTVINGTQTIYRLTDLAVPTIVVPTSSYVYEYDVVDSTGELVIPRQTVTVPTSISLGQVLFPNRPIHIRPKVGYITLLDGSSESVVIRQGNQDTSHTILYQLPPQTGHIYDYNTILRFSTAGDNTISVLRQNDVTSYRFYVWKLPNTQYDSPEVYLNLPQQGPFDAPGYCYVFDVQQPSAESDLDVITQNIDSIMLPATEFYAWACKPINAYNANMSDPSQEPWSISNFKLNTSFIWSEPASPGHAPIIGSPTGNETNLSPQLKVFGKLGVTYNYKLFAFTNGKWEHYKAIHGTIGPILDEDVAVVVPLIEAEDTVLDPELQFVVVVYDSAGVDCPGFGTFNTISTTTAGLSLKYKASPIIVNPTESNLRRYAAAVTSVSAALETPAPGQIAITRAIGISKPVSAVAIEVGKLTTATTTADAITCDIQFNDSGHWYPILPLGWAPFDDRAQVLFINTVNDAATKAKLEGVYGSKAFVDLDDIAFSFRLRFTLNDPTARVSKYIYLRGIA